MCGREEVSKSVKGRGNGQQRELNIDRVGEGVSRQHDLYVYSCISLPREEKLETIRKRDIEGRVDEVCIGEMGSETSCIAKGHRDTQVSVQDPVKIVL